MFTSCHRTYETSQPIAEIIQRWQKVIVDEASLPTSSAEPIYHGFMSDSGFYLTRRSYDFGKLVSEANCSGHFFATRQGTRIELEVRVTTTTGRILRLAMLCASIAVPVALVAMFWGKELPKPEDWARWACVALLLFIVGFVGASLMAMLFLFLSMVVVRRVARKFHDEMIAKNDEEVDTEAICTP